MENNTDIKVFEYGDFTFECSCGHSHVIGTNETGGRRLEIYCTDKHQLVLACSNCNTTMRLFYTEAANPPVQEATVVEEEKEEVQNEEPVQEEDKIKE